MNSYDLIVLGGGPAGYVAAAEAGKHGKSVLLIEADQLGGVCLNAGCIPTKTLLNTSKQFMHLRDGDVKGIAPYTAVLDWEQALAWKDTVVATYRKGVAGLLKNAKVEVRQGHGRFLDRSTVEVAGERVHGEAILIASGSRPALPPISGLTGNPAVFTSTELLRLKAIPKRLAVIGAGVIGLEFGAMYAQLGTRVDIIEMLPDIAPFLEPEIRRGLQRALSDITFHLGARVAAIESAPDGGVTVVYTQAAPAPPGGAPSAAFTPGGAPSAAFPSGGVPPAAASADVGQSHGEVDVAQLRVEADAILVATGRKANIEDLELEAAGVKTAKGFILVNERMETSAPRIYAAGDVTGTSLFAHSASRMAEVAVQVICGNRTAAMDYRAVPWAIYTWPEAAGCGLTESAAIQTGRAVRCAQLPMRLSARFYAENANQPGLVKAVADRDTGVLLGVQMLGANCSEMIWGATMAIQLGLTAREAATTIFPHPTSGEVLRDVFLKLDEGTP
jgi:dihydrolipoamide dehydrogenase